jgi:hypothetical protein
MRSVMIMILDASLDDVAMALREASCSVTDDRWTYPGNLDAVLYGTCRPYNLQEFPEDHADVLAHTAGRTPAVLVTFDVSGRVPGDAEVRYVARALLARFDGLAFDDFTWPEHGWTLAQIDSGHRANGLGFFDYRGYYERSKSREREPKED